MWVPTASAHLRPRHGADGHAAQLARGAERAEQPGVLLVAGEDLIARTQPQAVDYQREPLAGAGREREVLGRAAEQRGVGAAQRPAQLGAAFEVRERRPSRGLACQLLRGGLHGGGGQRAVGAGVQVGDASQHRELRA